MYIGNIPSDKYQTLQKQSFTTSATDTYTLDYAVTNPQDLALFINNVRQNPNDAYTVSGTTLTLSSAITSSDTMYAVFLGRAVETVAPAIGSVTNSMLSGSIANAKLANSSITLNGSAVSLGGRATVGGTNTPAFLAYGNTGQTVSNNTETIVSLNLEVFDSDGKYDTSTYKFTPTVVGKYFLFSQVRLNTDVNFNEFQVNIQKNGSDIARGGGVYGHYDMFGTSIIADLDADDYIQVAIYQASGSSKVITDSQLLTFLGGYKLIGA